MKLLPALLLLATVYKVEATICLDVCTCVAAKYPKLNRTLDTVDCSRIPAATRTRVALNETYGGNLAVILRRNDLYNTRQIEGLTTLHHLVYLDLSENSLRRFSNVIVEGKSLRALFLDANGFDYIPSLEDYGFTSLDILYLADNVIESIHAQAFRGLETLKLLNISNNRLSEIDSNWLYGLIELKTLDLSNNIIRSISADSFNSLISLHYLNLQGNTLHTVDSRLFVKNPNLETLHLDWNHLEHVPSEAFKYFRKIRLINLSGNHFTRLLPGTFSRINVTRLRLNDLSHLVIVDDGAFSDMPLLHVLEIHDNHRLRYIAPHAVVRAPNLRTIHCQNNKLIAFPKAILHASQNLHVLGIYGNPLKCDCNVHWLLENIYVERIATLLQVENTLCSSPKELLHEAVYKMDVSHTPAQCTPTVVDLLPEEISVFEEDTFSADCRAHGIPSSNISWILPNGDRLLSNTHQGNVAVTSSGTLLVSKVNLDHNGVFVCRADNDHGSSNRTMMVQVKIMNANIIVRQVRDHSTLLTWNGTLRDERYRITCSQYNNSTTVHTAASVVNIQPYWRSYTLQNLRPNTQYRLCISMFHQGHYHKERCLIITTLDKNVQKGIFSVKRYVVSALLGSGLILLLVLISVSIIYHQHYKKKKRLKELYGDNMSQLFLSSVSSFSDVTTPVTYENAAASTYDDVTDDEHADTKDLASSASEQLISKQ